MTWLEWLKDIWNTIVNETYRRELLMHQESPYYSKDEILIQE